MCGLVGIAGDLTFSDEARMRKLLLADYFRGMDATGFAAVKKKGDSVVVKVDSNPIVLFDMKSFDTNLSAYSSMAFIGHNRAATRGAKSQANAHPFKKGLIVGAHNGTLEVDSFLELNANLNKQYDVDSEAVFASIDEFGLKATMEDMDGAWALTYYDEDSETMNFIRNSKRPLFYCMTKDRKKLFWGSEHGIIDFALREGDKYGVEFDMDEEGYVYFSFLENMHYEVSLRDLMDGKINKLEECIVAEYKGRPPKPVVSRPMGVSTGPFVRKDPKPNTGTSTTTSPTSTEVPRGDRNGGTMGNINTVTIGTNDNDPYSGTISSARFNEIARGGCSFCAEPIHYEDEGVKVFVDEEIVLCPKCSGVTSKNTSEIVLASLEALL